ncbi:DUF6418 domain-containing protein [Psychromonas sp. KJ10-10]|uniref:DUF6418 domain-containing protein n=1 Tax=Psychromonas sp. KJ10-10 TaxID=3391823 RepID=UPI0039B40018
MEDIIENRLLLQGQLWFVADLYQSDNLVGLDSFVRNIPSFFHLSTNEFIKPIIPFGMRELMFIHAVPSVYDIYIENNVTFTMGQMAMLLFWFGYLGMVIPLVFTAVFFGTVIYYLNNAILRFDVISILLASKIFMWFVFGFQQGEYWYVWGIKTMIFCVFVYLFEKYRNAFGIKFLERAQG